MAVLRLGRFKTGPGGTREMLTGHAALAVAVKDALPGLIEMPLATPAAKGGPVYGAGAHSPACRRRCRRPASRGPGPRSRPQRHRDRIRAGRRCVIAPDPFTARTWQIRAAGAMRAAGPGLPRRPRSRGTALARRRKPGAEASRRERPGVASPLRDPRRQRPRRPVGGLVRRPPGQWRQHPDGDRWPALVTERTSAQKGRRS